MRFCNEVKNRSVISEFPKGTRVKESGGISTLSLNLPYFATTRESSDSGVVANAIL